MNLLNRFIMPDIVPDRLEEDILADEFRRRGERSRWIRALFMNQLLKVAFFLCWGLGTASFLVALTGYFLDIDGFTPFRIYYILGITLFGGTLIQVTRYWWVGVLKSYVKKKAK
jgi:hypothetical protein